MNRRRLRKLVFSGIVCAVLAAGAIAIVPTETEARPPRLLCGPTYMWSCSGPGGPDVLFVGTICEKRTFEKKSGLTCEPLGF